MKHCRGCDRDVPEDGWSPGEFAKNTGRCRDCVRRYRPPTGRKIGRPRVSIDEETWAMVKAMEWWTLDDDTRSRFFRS